MPWHQEATKEVEDCCKSRGVVNQAVIRECPNGETCSEKIRALLPEYIGQESERRELNHLSNARKRKRSDSLSSGERMGKSLNFYYVIACARCSKGVVRYIAQKVQFLKLN